MTQGHPKQSKTNCSPHSAIETIAFAVIISFPWQYASQLLSKALIRGAPHYARLGAGGGPRDDERAMMEDAY
jgi:hypothetical protein